MKNTYKPRYRERFAGLWAAVPTPFTSNGEIDEAGVRFNVAHFIDGLRLDGIFCNGLMGEIWALTSAERRQILEIILDAGGNRLLVAAVTTHHSLAETLELTLHAEAAGCHFAVLMNPARTPRSPDELYRYFSAICDRVGIEVIIFNTPLAGYTLSPELIARLCEIPNVCGVKTTASHFENARIRDNCGEKTVISDPHEENYLHNLLLYNQQILFADPEPYLFQSASDRPITGYRARYQQNDIAGFVSEFQALNPLRRIHNKWIMDPLRMGQMPIGALKYWCDLMGMRGGAVRSPLIPLSEELKAELRVELVQIGIATN